MFNLKLDKMRKLSYLAAFLAAFMMFSCTNNDNPVPGEEEKGDKTVELKIKSVITKSDDGAVINGAKTSIQDGVIYFFGANNGCVYRYQLTATDITNLAGQTVAPISVLNVPAAANKVILLTNYELAGYTYPLAAGNTVTSIKALPVNITKQQPKANNMLVANVIMSGAADIVIDTNPATPLYAANVTITPIMSRLEVSRVGVKGDGTQVGDITEFRLRGVFIPNHYSASTVMDNVTTSFVNPVNDKTKYTNLFPAGSAPGYLNDYVDNTAVFPGLAHAALGNMWAYHVFPASGSANLPHIVVAVDQIKFRDTDGQVKLWNNGATKYVTVISYHVKDNVGMPITDFLPANVYRIDGADGENGPGKPGGWGGIIFELDDLGDTPYSQDKTVSCNITVTPWNVNLIEPNM